MPKLRRYGDNEFGTLASCTPADKLSSGQLQECVNVSRESPGALIPTCQDAAMTGISMQSEPLGMACIRLNYDGHDHLIYWQDYAINEYDLTDAADTNIGDAGVAGSVRHRFVSDDARVFILNGVENWVWDGQDFRDHGPLGNGIANANDSGVITVGNFDLTVVAATQDTTCEITTSQDHHLTNGDTVTFNSMPTGWTALNGNNYTVTVSSGTKFTISVDTSGYTPAYSGSAGKAAPNPLTLAGNYKYAFAYRVALTNGAYLESSLYECWVDAGSDPDENTATPIALTSGDGILLAIKQLPQATIDAWAASSSGMTIQGIVYRSKVNGTDYYYHSTISQANIVGSSLYYVYDSVNEGETGAVYVYKTTDRSSPPVASMGVVCQRKLFLAGNPTYPNRLYWSMNDDPDYFPPANAIDCCGRIMALSRFGENVAVWTGGRIQMYYPTDEVGQLADTQSPVGTNHPDSICVTELGTIFARGDGIWLFSGVTSENVSPDIDLAWDQGTWIGAYFNGVGYYTNGGGANIRFEIIDRDIIWGTYDTQDWGAFALSPGDDAIYAYGSGLTYPIYNLEAADSRNTMTARTRFYGSGMLGQAQRLIVDYGGTVTATVTNSRGGTVAFTLTTTAPVRRTERRMLPASMISEWFDVTFTGTGTVYSVALDVLT